MATKTAKSENTRSQVYEIAVRLFAERGFDQTSMRMIAKEAGIAAGGIYYHFSSKEALVFEYYKRSHEDHLNQVGDFLKSEKDFQKRLHKVVTDKILIAEPYKDMARALFRVAADPKSPLSPFSEESKELREESQALFEEIVFESNNKFHSDVKKELPAYLWLFQMGIILFWIYDTSPKSKRTFQLIDQTVPLIVEMNKLMLNPMSGFVRKPILQVLKRFNINEIQNPKKEV